MHATSYATNLVFERHRAVAALRMAHKWSVENGGLYEATTSTINVWLFPHVTPELRDESELIGTIKIEWNCPDQRMATIAAIEVQPGWSRHDVERHIQHLFGVPVLAKAA